MNQRYFKIREDEPFNTNEFIDYIDNKQGLYLKNATVSDPIKKKVIHEYQNKEGVVDLSYYFDDIDIYESRVLTLNVHCIGNGLTEVEKENDAYNKVNLLNRIFLDHTKGLQIKISKYNNYYFKAIPVSMSIAEKAEKDSLGLIEVIYEFQVNPEAIKLLEGRYPIELYEKQQVGYFLKTFFDKGISGFPFNLTKKTPIRVYLRDQDEEFLKLASSAEAKIKYPEFSLNINGYILTKNENEYKFDFEKRRIYFTVDSIYLNNGENYISFNAYKTYDFYIIIENAIV